MRCKKCNSEITYDTNYCPYCGERIKEYDDPFKSIRINSNENQINYQKKRNNIKDELEINSNKDNKSLLGLILAIMSIPTTIYNYKIGIVVAIVSFILTIIGLKHTKKSFGVLSIILSIFTLIISLIITTVIMVGSIVITFENGYETTILDYFKDCFINNFEEDKLIGYWTNDDYGIILENNKYYIYINKKDKTNYYYGNYKLENGIYLDDDNVMYGDKDYYYYKITLDNNRFKGSNTIYSGDSNKLKTRYILKLSKKNKENLIVEDYDENIFEFKKQLIYSK